MKAKKIREEHLKLVSIEDVTNLLKSIVRESLSVMQRRLELFEMFHA